MADSAVNDWVDVPAGPAQATRGANDWVDVPKQTPEKPGYWQELWQQYGIPGLVKGIKEHPAETVANAIGGLFGPLNPNFTQSPQAEAIKDNWTRSPQSAAAQATIGALAAVPAIAKLELPQATGAAVKAGAPGVLSGAAKIAGGEALGHIPGMEWPARVAMGYPGIRDIARGLGKGANAFREYYNPPAEAAAKAAAPTAATLADGTTVDDILRGQGVKNPAKATPEARATAQTAFDRLKAQEQMQPQAAEPPKAYAPRPPEHYGVKAAEAPPENPAPSAPAPTTAPAAAPEPTPIRSAAGDAIKAKNAAAKSTRYAKAIDQWARNYGMSGNIAEQWEAATPEVRGQILVEAQRKGYLGANETIPDTSAPGIVEALKRLDAARVGLRNAFAAPQ